MKDNIDDKLNDLLDIDTEIKTVSSNVVKVTPRSESIESDYKYARENLYNLVERGQDAIEGILELSKETEHPRAYEVAGHLIKTAEKLLDVQKKIKDLEKDDERKIGTQHNHLYVGSTSELQKFLKKEKQKE
jgi:hypothetical protein